MSAWPEAVWIVKKLQKNFDFDQQIREYQSALIATNTTVNALNDRVSGDQARLATDEQTLTNLTSTLTSRAITIRATKKSSGGPNTTQSFGKGTIWFVVS